ncbi:MAG: asparagine synthase (glutamine-hydrolyzing) [Actinomycetota bacterium]|nr:asparagine synthase (glutamine-hydrolyzing) [Actinomycetota bacterium]
MIDAQRRSLDRVLDLACTLHHRGPDSMGAYERSGAAIAQTRLAIIDLVTGDPPITNEDGTLGVAFNGEIYNYRLLQRQLRQTGHQLKTECDTEVIAHLAEDHEPVALARQLDGMFAFAVWDDRRRRLVLGRDRFGKKPLYYWTDGHRFVFGSELKAVLADPYVPRSLDPLAIPAYLTFGYVPTPRTFFEGIRSVPPGHVLTFDASGTVTLERYWHPPLPGVDGCGALDLSFEEARREVRRLLCDAVDRRLISDVPLGAFLSGGIDSSAVVAFMARLSPEPVKTFTIGFDDREGFDERPYAAEVARHFGTQHTEFVVSPDTASLIERLVIHHDQPFGDSTALPTFLLSELTRDHVTVALCGDGGDELFAGYERFAAARALQRLARVPAPVVSGLCNVAARIPAGAFGGRAGGAVRMLERIPVGMPDAYLSWLSYVPEEWRQRLLEHPSDWAHDDYRAIWRSTEGAAPLDRLLNLNLRTYLLDDLLPKVDRMAMAHGLEVRSPFLDTELAEFMLRLPPNTKIAGVRLKRVLKAAVRDLLPPEILRRRKRGFGVPLDRWFRTDLRGYVDSMLCAPNARVGRHLDPAAVRALVAAHHGGADNLGHALWTLLTLEVFLRHEGW